MVLVLLSAITCKQSRNYCLWRMFQQRIRYIYIYIYVYMCIYIFPSTLSRQWCYKVKTLICIRYRNGKTSVHILLLIDVHWSYYFIMIHYIFYSLSCNARVCLYYDHHAHFLQCTGAAWQQSTVFFPFGPPVFYK